MKFFYIIFFLIVHAQTVWGSDKNEALLTCKYIPKILDCTLQGFKGHGYDDSCADIPTTIIDRVQKFTKDNTQDLIINCSHKVALNFSEEQRTQIRKHSCYVFEWCETKIKQCVQRKLNNHFQCVKA